MKRFNVTFVLLLCALLILSLSVSAEELKSNKPISFQGESENWAATYTVEVLDGLITQEGFLKYKGQNVGSTGKVSSSYETTAGGLSSTSRLADTGIDSPIGEKGTQISKGAGGNINLYSKVEMVKVTVKWDGKVELFN